MLLIISDEEAKGFLFSYEKLFGVKSYSKTDLENQKDGKETGFDRTLRLFYVSCSRARKSLAIIAYSENPKLLETNVVQNGWFSSGEVSISN